MLLLRSFAMIGFFAALTTSGTAPAAATVADRSDTAARACITDVDCRPDSECTAGRCHKIDVAPKPTFTDAAVSISL
jgi:hypothetical protein